MSYYLPPALAGQAEALRAGARLAAAGKLGRLPREAGDLYPGNTGQADRARARYIAALAEQLGQYYTRQIPRGAVARMAIHPVGDRRPHGLPPIRSPPTTPAQVTGAHPGEDQSKCQN